MLLDVVRRDMGEMTAFVVGGDQLLDQLPALLFGAFALGDVMDDADIERPAGAQGLADRKLNGKNRAVLAPPTASRPMPVISPPRC